MNILLYSWDSNSENDLCETFDELKIDYTKFSHSVNDYENDLEFWNDCREEIQKENYDAIFSFDYFPILSKIAEKEKLVYFAWVYDSPHFTLYSYTIYNSCNRIFFFDKTQQLYFKARGLENGYYMPLAVNTKRLEHQLGTNINNVDYQHEISFVGSLYNDNLYAKIKYLPEYTKGYLEGIIDAQSKVYGYNFVYEMITPKLLKELNEFISFNNNKIICIPEKIMYADIINTRITELDRVGMISALAEHWNMDLYTNSSSEVLRNTNNLGVVDYHEEMPKVFRNSKINLNISHRSITSGIPLRVLDIMGSGGFCISNYQVELAEYFELDKEIVIYDSKEDLINKAAYYLSHDEERIAIIERGNKKVKELFSYEKLIKDILTYF